MSDLDLTPTAEERPHIHNFPYARAVSILTKIFCRECIDNPNGATTSEGEAIRKEMRAVVDEHNAKIVEAVKSGNKDAGRFFIL